MAIERWEIDSAHSGIHFSVRHMVVAKVRGQFARWSGNVVIENGNLERAVVSATIDTASVTTGVAERDAHLASADFFDVAHFPEMNFRSRHVKSLGAGTLQVVGDLTIRGITREVVLEVESAGRTRDPWGNERSGYAAKTSVNRHDFGLTWNQTLETGGLVVGDRIDIEIEVEAVLQAEAHVA